MENWSSIAKVYDTLKAGSIDGTDTRAHDRGIERAMQAKYKPNKDLTGKPDNTLFIGRLNPDTDEKSLLKALQRYGEIVSVSIIRDIVTGFSKCYGFVEFKQEKSAMRAWQDAHEDVIDERVVFVDWEFSRTLPGWVPRRLGGGFGGKKESGQLRFGGRDRPFKMPIMLTKMRDFRGYQRDKRAYRQDRERERDRDRERKRYRDRDERDKYRDRSEERNSGRNRYRDRERERDRNRDREKDRDNEKDSHRERHRIKIEKEDTD